MNKKECFSITCKSSRLLVTVSRVRTEKISVNNENAMDKADRKDNTHTYVCV